MSSQTVLSVDGSAALNPAQPAFYFDFGPVLERSQALRRHPERIQLMCENCVKRLAPADIMLPQESGFFLILLSVEGGAAETLAQEINIALLELFFGTDTLNQNLGSICRRATLQEISAKGITIPAIPKKPSATEKVEADPLARLAQSGLAGYEGLSTGFAPVINLARDNSALYLCGPTRQHKGRTLFGLAALAGINRTDRASLDEGLLEYSLGFASAKPDAKSATAVVAPVHYETLAWSRGRQIYQKALRTADVAANPFLLVKIEGIPTGTPAARLTEIISMVRPFVRRVFVELSEWDPNLMRGGHLGVAGFMSALPDNASLPVAGRAMAHLVQFAAAQQALACITNVSSANHLALARAAGVRFAVRSTAGGVIQLAPHDEAADHKAAA
jgi:hypothetical protein